MEVSKVFFTEQEKVKWFTDNGYTVVNGECTDWVTVSHNQMKPVKLIKAMVLYNGKKYSVDELFNDLFNQQYKKLFTPVNLETKRKIERTIKNLKNGRN